MSDVLRRVPEGASEFVVLCEFDEESWDDRTPEPVGLDVGIDDCRQVTFEIARVFE